MRFFYKLLLGISIFFIYDTATAQHTYTRQEVLRGSIGTGRQWWDVMNYDLNLNVDMKRQIINGYNDITFKITKNSKDSMQIDLQEPMQIEKIENLSGESGEIPFVREGNVFWLDIKNAGFGKTGTQEKIRVHFKGAPRVAKNAPWDGGWVWALDSLKRPWATVACQGLGASVWYPCKDHQSDEPNKGATITITVPDSLVAVANGRLASKQDNGYGTTSWMWQVKNPINNYLIVPSIGKYVNFTDTLQGEKGTLDVSYWVLDYNLNKAKKQFEVVKPMLHCFEYWMGPYPFYEDSYKLVESPHLGMEHQSAVAYGNQYKMGYRGNDLSGTGWGKKWDFIIVHESGHEWFANNITTKDISDMWVHESFTAYAETLFTTCQYGKQAGNEYVTGTRKNVKNDIPIIGVYGVNKEGSGDMYYKGANMLHTIRQVYNNDDKFRKMLRGLGKSFYHQTVRTNEVESYISNNAGINLNKVFDQYLRTTKIPVFEYYLDGGNMHYRWANCVSGFNMPVKLTNGTWLKPTEKYQKISPQKTGGGYTNISIDPNFYVEVKNTNR